MKRSMKSIYLIVITAVFVQFYIGCSSGHRTTNPNVVSEHQLQVQDVAYANEDHIVLLSLEHPFAEQDWQDTHQIGSDCFEIRPTADLEDIELFIEENISVASLTVRDLQSGEQMAAHTEGSTTTVTFTKDKRYELCVTHDGLSERSQPLFVLFDAVDTQESALRFDQDAINTLKATNKCVGCDLSNYDFSYYMKDLSGVDISEANLSKSDFYNVVLDGAHLNSAILTDADLSRVSMLRSEMKHVTTLQKSIENYAFTPRNIDYASFAHSDLSGFDMSDYPRYELHDVNFSYSDLTGANMKDRNFSNGDFKNAVLSRAHLEDNVFEGSDLTNATLAHSFLDRVHFNRVNLDDSNLTGASFTDGVLYKPTSMKGVQMPGFQLQGYDFNGLNLSGANLSGANLNGANLNGATLSGSNMHGTDFSGASMRDATCIDVNFTTAIFAQTDITHVTMDYSDFRGSTLQDALFIDPTTTVIEYKSFIGANISGIIFNPDTYPWFTNFSHAICHETDFSETDLGNTDFSYADCQGAVFADTRITFANFSYANLLHSTIDDADSMFLSNFSYAIWSDGYQCKYDSCPYYQNTCSGKCL